jgi:hypothetical protein
MAKSNWLMYLTMRECFGRGNSDADEAAGSHAPFTAETTKNSFHRLLALQLQTAALTVYIQKQRGRRVQSIGQPWP